MLKIVPTNKIKVLVTGTRNLYFRLYFKNTSSYMKVSPSDAQKLFSEDDLLKLVKEGRKFYADITTEQLISIVGVEAEVQDV